ncbi:uncharacterized protein LOC135439943 isoform X2 [Drosophila montana]|uniref:uncharacterized protein LOC135439943 isoform X2 n=1 Tax=Drosophila montana TaxID=40370 RepID=UPI00313DEA73
MDSHHVRNTDFWKDFFRLYRSMPELWLTNSKDYRNRKLKARSYDRLLAHMLTTDPTANIHMVKRKINNLRTSYRRELRKVLESKSSMHGHFAGEEYVPSLWYFNELEFLYDQETGEAQTLIDAEPEPELEPEPESKHEQHTENEADNEPEYLKQRVELTYNENVVEVEPDEDIFAEPFPPEEDMLVIEGEGEGEGEGEADGDAEGIADADGVLDTDVEHEALAEARHKSDLKMEIKYQQHSNSSSGNNNNNSSSGAVGGGVGNGKHPYGTARPQQQQQQQQPRRSIAAQQMRRRQRSSDGDAEGDYDESSAASGKKRRQMLECSMEHVESECDLIGKRMAAHFRNMRPDQRLFAERIISEVLVYGRMNRLSLDARFLPSGSVADLYAHNDGK